jgi:hypothetical protein
MSFIELNRCFVPLTKDQEPILDAGISASFPRCLHRRDRWGTDAADIRRNRLHHECVGVT